MLTAGDRIQYSNQFFLRLNDALDDDKFVLFTDVELLTYLQQVGLTYLQQVGHADNTLSRAALFHSVHDGIWQSRRGIKT